MSRSLLLPGIWRKFRQTDFREAGHSSCRNSSPIWVRLWQFPDTETLKGKRDRAIIAAVQFVVRYPRRNLWHAVLFDRSTFGTPKLWAASSQGQTYIEKNDTNRAETVLSQAVEIGRMAALRNSEMVEVLELYSRVLTNLFKTSEANRLQTEAARLRSELAFTVDAKSR
jgi:hypothetical protein